ncbi:zinc-dependent peptidase [Luteibaculum oceani]|uniref:Zinc-dependent peptidase n=1 Tax=Luteibaculum oceani TaxID=1294296 RepID=A0A5C6V0V2_9FLAO|nr:zinc-dependent peptidase [Luteibaculum oceani]TXC78574.1 zinc-dependent peptidase [Luteibaculum oceani]
MRLKYKIHHFFTSKRTLANCHRMLNRWNPYYAGLSPELQKAFQLRILHFQRNTVFECAPGLNLTNQMELIISGGFVQLTFGFKKDVLDVFNYIYLAAKPYSYRHIAGKFKGDVNPHKHRVTLTWPYVEKGFVIPDDGLNLVLHEFAHCLYYENQLDEGMGQFLDNQGMKDWHFYAAKKRKRILNGDQRLFRTYAAKNMLEMFAVSAEVFFEQPKHFARKEPRLYDSMCKLYNQDPRNWENPRLKEF